MISRVTISRSGVESFYKESFFCLVKNKKVLDLQVFTRVGKTIKKLQWIPNTIMNTTAYL